MSAHDPRTSAEQDDPVKLRAHIEKLQGEVARLRGYLHEIEEAESLAVAASEARRALYL